MRAALWNRALFVLGDVTFAIMLDGEDSVDANGISARCEFHESPNLALVNALNLLIHGFEPFLLDRHFELYLTFGSIIRVDRGIDHFWRILNNDRTVEKLGCKI